MLIKLNIVIFLPIVIYVEKTKNEKLYTTIGMLFGLIVQTFFSFTIQIVITTLDL